MSDLIRTERQQPSFSFIAKLQYVFCDENGNSSLVLESFYHRLLETLECLEDVSIPTVKD